MPDLPGPFWLIGCGNMAGAMLQGWLDAAIDASLVSVIRPSGAPAPGGVRVLKTLPRGEVPALVMLGMKPQMIDKVAPDVAAALGPDTIVISILAGVEQASLRARFPDCGAIFRAMPNTPVRLRKGAIGLYGDGADAAARDTVGALMTALGRVEWLDDERMLDVVTALSGSGPAFVFRFIDALAAAGADLGMAPEQAARLALATVEGAGALAASASESPTDLAERVASPGGSTRKGLDILDTDERLLVLLRDTLGAAVRRNREMATEARRG